MWVEAYVLFCLHIVCSRASSGGCGSISISIKILLKWVWAGVSPRSPIPEMRLWLNRLFIGPTQTLWFKESLSRGFKSWPYVDQYPGCTPRYLTGMILRLCLRLMGTRRPEQLWASVVVFREGPEISGLTSPAFTRLMGMGVVQERPGGQLSERQLGVNFRGCTYQGYRL